VFEKSFFSVSPTLGFFVEGLIYAGGLKRLHEKNGGRRQQKYCSELRI